MTTIKAGSTVIVRRTGAKLSTAKTHTLRRDVVVSNARRWGTFSGVDRFVGQADGFEIEFGDDDTVGYEARNPSRGKPDCPKCSGRGNLPQFAHVQGGKCFACRPILT